MRTPCTPPLPTANQIEADLQTALERDEFFLLYQPIFDLESSTIKGVEALLRWQHPTRGTISRPIHPDRGGEWSDHRDRRSVLLHACRQAGAWHERGHPIGISVNVSAVQVDQPDFVERVAGALELSGLKPAWLTIEITETVLMKDAEASAKRLHALKELGVRIAIDDFGTGYIRLPTSGSSRLTR